MTDLTSFESQFATAVNHYADQIRTEVDPHRVTALARSSSERSWVRRAAVGPRFNVDHRFVVIAAVILVLVAFAALSVAGAWLAKPEQAPAITVATDRPVEPPDSTVATDQFFQIGQSGDGGWWNAALLADGNVLLVGGLSADRMSPQTGFAAILDPRSGAIRPTGALSTPRAGASLTTLQDGRILVAGGMGSQDTLLASVEIYDPATGTFSAATPMRSAGLIHTATLLDDGRVLVVGLKDGIAEVYDPASDSWRSAGTTVARGSNSATRLTDGRVLVVGGWGGPQRVSAASEIFDASTDTFSPSGTLGLRRNQHGAVLLDDGKVLIVGGRTNPDGFTLDTEVASAEIYDPTTGAFHAVADLRWARGGRPAAVQVPDGRVLVLGGGDDSGAVLDTELFDPKQSSFSVGPRAAGYTIVALGLAGGWVLDVSDAGIEIFVPTGAVRPTWAALN
jgi:hypothetical protein